MISIVNNMIEQIHPINFTMIMQYVKLLYLKEILQFLGN